MSCYTARKVATTTPKAWHKWVKQAAVLCAIFAAWQLAATAGVWSELILPAPRTVWLTFVAMLRSGELLEHVWVSTTRVIIGFAISFVLAFFLGMLAGLKPRVTHYYDHVLEFLRHVPPLALIPLLILWFGIGETSRIVIIVLTMFFPVYFNVRKGFLSCDPKLLEVGETLGMNSAQRFVRIVVPQALPNILVGMRVGLGFAWRAIIGAEMVAAAAGLGYFIWHARQMSRSAAVVVGILTIGVIGMLFDALFRVIIKRAIKGGVDDSWS